MTVSESPARRELCEQLHRRMQAVQQQNHFIARAYDTPLTLAESHLLVELDADRTKTAGRLAELLDLSKTAVSRLIEALVRKKYLEVRAHRQDQRRRVLMITTQGRAVLSRMDKNANEAMGKFANNLSLQQQERFQHHMHKMNNGYGAPLAAQRPHDHPLLAEGRRRTRAMGFLGRAAYHTGSLSTFDWHILLYLSEFSEGSSPSALISFFHVPANTMSQAVARLETRGLVSSSRASADRRRKNLRATKLGCTLLAQLERIAVSQLQQALRAFSDVELAEFAELYAKFSGVPDDSGSEILRGRIRLEIVDNHESRQSARSFLVTQLVREGRTSELQERVISKESLVYALYLEGRVKGVAEYFRRKGKGWVLQYIAVDRQGVGEELAREFRRLTAGKARLLNKES